MWRCGRADEINMCYKLEIIERFQNTTSSDTAYHFFQCAVIDFSCTVEEDLG